MNMSEALSVLKTAETFLKLIWTPRIGDHVKLNGIKDTVAGISEDGRAFLSRFPQHPYKASELEFRPTSQDYLEIIKMFHPGVLHQLNLIKPNVYLARCACGPFNFAVQGKPKVLLAKLLQTRLYLSPVNYRVNEIVEATRNAGITNVPKLRLVHSTN